MLVIICSYSAGRFHWWLWIPELFGV